MDYDTISAEVRRLSYALDGADPAAVAAEQARLRELAAGIADEVSRRSALARVDALPRSVSQLTASSKGQRRGNRSVVTIGPAYTTSGPVMKATDPRVSRRTSLPLSKPLWRDPA